MSKQTINLGVSPSGLGGDTPRSALLKTQANVDELYAALGGNTLPTTLPITKGGTGATTVDAARTALGLKRAAISDVVGVVNNNVNLSDVMEYGNTGENYYLRFACGTQWVWGSFPNLSVSANAWVLMPVVYYAASFVGAQQSVWAFGTPNISADVYGFNYNNQNYPGYFQFAFRNGGTAQVIANNRYMAIGRWK